MGHLNEGRKGFMGGLSRMFGNNDNVVASPGEAAAKADLYIAVNASTIELVDIEKYVAEHVGDKPIVLWNLELDTLRADLGISLKQAAFLMCQSCKSAQSPYLSLSSGSPQYLHVEDDLCGFTASSHVSGID